MTLTLRRSFLSVTSPTHGLEIPDVEPQRFVPSVRNDVVDDGDGDALALPETALAPWVQRRVYLPDPPPCSIVAPGGGGTPPCDVIALGLGEVARTATTAREDHASWVRTLRERAHRHRSLRTFPRTRSHVHPGLADLHELLGLSGRWPSALESKPLPCGMLLA